MTTVGLVDYGIGNLLSVARAFEHAGAAVKHVHTPDELRGCDRLILPGVGAFADGMKGLWSRDMVEPLGEYAKSGRPFLGICLGMQMLFDTSEEFGEHQGLGLIPGRVVAIPAVGIDRRPHKIPHIGWNPLVLPPERKSWEATPLQGVRYGDPAYFVHSFTAAPANEADRLADCHYNGVVISAMVARGNVFGAQFHPEKSGEMGLRIIRNFLKI